MLNALDLKKGQFVGFVDLEKPKPIAIEGVPLRWHIVITEFSRERTTVERIEELGLRPYLPVLHQQVLAGRQRKRDVEVAMFRSHIFVPMPLDESSWHRVRATRGVRDFLTTDGQKPALLRDLAIEDIRRTEARVDAKYRRRLATEEQTPYRKGRKVWAELLPSPFNKLLATIEGLDDRGRVNVLLEIELLGRRSWPVEPHMLQFADQ
jgi:transcription antitermination factor NusG